ANSKKSILCYEGINESLKSMEERMKIEPIHVAKKVDKRDDINNEKVKEQNDQESEMKTSDKIIGKMPIIEKLCPV
ncbi:hypothetical protein ACUWCL_28925, partial [Klebsiella pneumoniae]|uniref:hypothetical protein n=1 Tax=Klebsiella pneumoniae TaxID=573 RepID=UPI004055980C